VAIPLKHRWRTGIVLLLAMAGLCASGTAGALERGPLEATERPWSALGRVNAAGTSYCSGTLVGPALVLTAAHCVFDFRNHRWWPVDDISFVAGYLRGKWVATARAKRVIRNQSILFVDRHPILSAVPEDWALIELDAPIGNVAGWLPLSHAPLPPPGDLTLQAGYRRDRPYAPELSPPCRILESSPDDLIFHDCVVPEGGSGSPLLVVDGSVLRVIGVHSAQVHRTRGENVQVFSAVVPVTAFAGEVPEMPSPSASTEAARRALLTLVRNGSALSRLNIQQTMQRIYALRGEVSQKSP
jgi:protease YdgD